MLIMLVTINLAIALICSFLIRQAYVRYRFGRGALPLNATKQPVRFWVTVLMLIVGLVLSVNYLVLSMTILAGSVS